MTHRKHEVKLAATKQLRKCLQLTNFNDVSKLNQITHVLIRQSIILYFFTNPNKDWPRPAKHDNLISDDFILYNFQLTESDRFVHVIRWPGLWHIHIKPSLISLSDWKSQLPFPFLIVNSYHHAWGAPVNWNVIGSLRPDVLSWTSEKGPYVFYKGFGAWGWGFISGIAAKRSSHET